MNYLSSALYLILRPVDVAASATELLGHEVVRTQLNVSVGSVVADLLYDWINDDRISAHDRT